MFFDNYMKVCESKGISPTRVLSDLQISKSAYTHWKNGGEPLNETKKAIADYFGITVSQLVSGETEKAPAKEAEAGTDDEMAELLEEVRNRPDLRALFSLSKKATPDDVRKMMKIIKTIRGDDDYE